MCSSLDVESHPRTTPSSSLALSLATCISREPLPQNAMRLKPWTCKVASQYRKKCRGFVRQRLLLQRPLIASTSSAFLVCLRRSRLSSVNVLTSWPFGRTLKGGRATRNRCCKEIQLIHVHVLVVKRSATPGPQQKNSFTGALFFPKNDTHSSVVLRARTADVRALDTPSSRATWSSDTTAAYVAASTTAANSRPVCRTRGRVRCQICCLSRSSDVIVVVSGPSMVSMVFRLVRSCLFCNSGFWLRRPFLVC